MFLVNILVDVEHLAERPQHLATVSTIHARRGGNEGERLASKRASKVLREGKEGVWSATKHMSSDTEMKAKRKGV